LDLKPDLSGWRRGISVAAVGLLTFIGRRNRGIPASKTLALFAVAGAAAVGLAGAVAFGFAFAGIVALPGRGAFTIVVARTLAIAVMLAVAVAVVPAGIVSGILALALDASANTVATFLIACIAIAFVFATVFAVIGAFARAGTVAVAIVIVFVIGGAIPDAVAHDKTFADAITFAFSSAFVFATATAVVLAVAIAGDMADKSQRQGAFLLMFLFVMFLTCLAAADFLSSLPAWKDLGPLLLFLGLLTLLNAPFDWASLGLTRALLRRGLELGGWWPYFLALVDALLAGVIIAVLALTMVIGVQAFDTLAKHGGGKPILPLVPLFDGLAAHPEAPEYWWIYALLLSTMVPSLVNLVIGGTALTRTAPGLSSLLLRSMPAGRAVPAFDQAWVALVLTLQVVGGVILGVAAQALLAAGLIRYVMPWLGLGLLDLARSVAAFDLPARVGTFF
jgi:hypothetical protein